MAQKGWQREKLKEGFYQNNHQNSEGLTLAPTSTTVVEVHLPHHLWTYVDWVSSAGLALGRIPWNQK
jgi:hypothetical protein